MNMLPILALAFFCFTSCNCNSDSYLSATEFTILHSTYMQVSLLNMLTKSGCIPMETQKNRDAFASAFINFYNYYATPSPFVDAERDLLYGEGSKSFEKALKIYCRKELWFFSDTAYTDIITALECHPEIRAIAEPIENWDEWLVHFEMCDQLCQYVLIDEYGNIFNHNFVKRRFVEDAGKNIELCRQAFAKALEIEQIRCGGKERIAPVFFLVCGSIASSYRVPEDFLVHFRNEMVKYAVKARGYQENH